MALVKGRFIDPSEAIKLNSDPSAIEDLARKNYVDTKASKAILNDSGLIFVSANGDDGLGDGGRASPYRTLNHALSVAADGAVIMLMPGDYYDASPITIPSSLSRLTIQGFGTDNTHVPNGLQFTSSTNYIQLDIYQLDFTSLALDLATATSGGIVNIKNSFGSIARTDTTGLVLVNVAGSSIPGGSFAGGGMALSQCLLLSDISISGGRFIIENSKFVACKILASGPASVRTTDCIHFGDGVWVDGTVVGVDTPTWETDTVCDYSGSSTGTVNKVLLAKNQAVPHKEERTITNTDITNGYVDLVGNSIAESMCLSISGTVQYENQDYTLSVVGGVTRVSFIGDLSTVLTVGDILHFQYWSAT